MRTRTKILLAFSLVSVALAGCGGDDEEGPCTAGTSTGCKDGRVCENVAGGSPTCFAPIEIHGRVFNSITGAGIEGATIVALDVNGGARSPVAISGANGAYQLPIPTERDADGNPTSTQQLTLRVAAAGYQPFPTAPRTALPIDTATAVAGMNESVIQNAVTDVALIPLEGDTTGFGSIQGSIDHDDAGGVLVVATQGGSAVSTAITDSEGDFILFNVPPGSTVVDGFRAGLNVEEATVEVVSRMRAQVTLVAGVDGLTSVSGSINIVNPGDGTATSIILVVASTFDPTVGRGEAPAGLKTELNVTNTFTIENVPPGRYVVLAAFENDFLVRDPDTSIGGTATQMIDVVAGTPVMIAESFKITGALGVMSPGATGIETVSAVPTLTWEDDSSEDGYELYIYDARGEIVHMNDMIASVSGSASVTYTPAGLTLEDGMIYQFRAYSFHDSTSGRTYISATEDLKGVFLFDSTPAM